MARTNVRDYEVQREVDRRNHERNGRWDRRDRQFRRAPFLANQTTLGPAAAWRVENV